MLRKNKTAYLIFAGAVFLSFAFWVMASDETEMGSEELGQDEEVEKEMDEGETQEGNDEGNNEEESSENETDSAENTNTEKPEITIDKVQDASAGMSLEEPNVSKESSLEDKENLPKDEGDESNENEEEPKEEKEKLKFKISEVMYYPEVTKVIDDKTDRKYYQWVEIINTNNSVKIDSNKKVNSKYVLDFKVCDRYDNSKCKNSYPVYYEQEKLNLDSNEIFIIARNKEIFENIYPDYKGKVLESNFNLSSTLNPNFLGLFTEEKSETIWIDELKYDSDWGGKRGNKTIERINYKEDNSKNNWEESVLSGGTPGRKYEKIDIIYSDKIVINEIFPNPFGDEETGEWIEIYCFNEVGIDLRGWLLEDAGGKAYIFEEERIENGEYLLVERIKSKIALNNSNETLSLKNPSGRIVNDLSYGKSQEGFSYALDENGDYQWTDILTPGEKNKFPEKKVYPRNIFLNEVMSNPPGIDKNNEWVEIYNGNDFEVDLNGWRIINGKEGTFIIDSLVALPGELTVVKIEDSSFSIRNSDEKVRLADPNGEDADRVEIEGVSKQGSSYNKNEKGSWSWSRFATPGKANRINNLPRVKIDKPKDFYKDIKAEFDASGTFDKDGDELKFRWEFGDGRRSYLEETSHKYEKKGKYKIILRVDDGSAEVFEEFWIKVEDFPDYDLEIVRLLTNPSGADTGNEEIEIKNNESKDLNLEGWKIATGSEKDKVTNHPIYEEEIVKAKKTIILKNVDCHFSLANKKGVVILRYPNDEIADEVEYEKEKIKEGEEYISMEDGWIWVGGEIKKESAISILGQNAFLPLVFGQKAGLGSDFWQEIMSDQINSKTLNMRGLMAFNWLLREKGWIY